MYSAKTELHDRAKKESMLERFSRLVLVCIIQNGESIKRAYIVFSPYRKTVLVCHVSTLISYIGYVRKEESIEYCIIHVTLLFQTADIMNLRASSFISS